MKAAYSGSGPAKSSNQLRLESVPRVQTDRFNVIAGAQLALVAAIGGGGATVWLCSLTWQLKCHHQLAHNQATHSC